MTSSLPPANAPGWIKICGIMRRADAQLAAELGANALGFIFAPSPRRIAPADAAAIIAELPAHLLPVGVFVNATPEDMLAAARQSGVRALQLHGHEPAGCAALLRDFPLIKALAAPPELSLDVRALPEIAGLAAAYRDWEKFAAAWLLDQKIAPGRRHAIAPFPAQARWILAGSLDPAAVHAAIRDLFPWGVDVASGVESSPGVKDPARLRDFIANARAGFASLAANQPASDPPASDWMKAAL